MSNRKSLSRLESCLRGALLSGAAAALLILAPPASAQEKELNLPNLFKSPTPRLQSDPKAVEIVERYLDAIGGKDVLSKITDRTISYTNTLYQPTSEAKAEISLMIKDHYNLREEWTLEYEIQEGQPLAFVQVYNGDADEAWVQVMGRVDKLEGKTLLVFVHAKYMDDFLCHWEEDGYVLTLSGEAEIDAGSGLETCDILTVTDFTGRQTERYFFSRKSGLLLKKEWRDSTRTPNKPMKREQYFKRYKAIPFMDNPDLAITFSMHQEIYGDGDLDTERAYTLVKFNSGLSDKLFDRPEGAPGPSVTSSGRVAAPVATPVSLPAPPTPTKKTEGSAPKASPGSALPSGLKKTAPLPSGQPEGE